MIRKDRLDALILLSGDTLVRENVELFRNTDTSATPCPRSLDRRIKRLIDREERAREYGSVLHYAKQCAAVFFAVCTLSLALLLSIDEVRAAVWDFIVEFYDDYLAVTFESKAEIPKVLEVKEIDTGREDWEKSVLLDTVDMYAVAYYENGSVVLTYTQVIIGGESWIDNENSTVEEVNVGDNPALLVCRNDRQTYCFSWSDGQYSFALDSHSPDITKKELLRMAETMKK